MANEFIARKGIISLDSAQITGSLSVTGNISASIFTGSFVGDGSQLSGIEGFPFTGSAGITGSLTVVGPVNATTFTGDGSQLTGIEGFPFTGSAGISGSLTVVGPVNATSFTGSLQGTATSASYIQLANIDGFTAYSASVNTAIDSVLDATTPLTATVNTGSSPFTLTSQSIVVADSTDGNLTINLPDLNTIVGTPNQKPIIVYKNDYSQNVIYVQPSGSQLVNGASQDIIVSIQLAVIYNPTSAGWVTEGTSAQSLAELELFFLPLTETGSLATTGSNQFNGNQTITGSLIHGLEGNLATGDQSHAEGSVTKAIGNYSHAEGDFTQAKGDYSHAEGQETIASGSYSHAEGYQTIALGQRQHVTGQYNFVSPVQSAFIVGNGTDDSNRSNLIHAAGNEVQITGSLTVTGGITGSATSASYVEYTNVANKPALVSGSSQIFAGYDYEIHVSQVDGNDTTGNGDLLTPVASITKALTLTTSSRKTIIIHPGTYSENITVGTTNTTISTSELTGANTLLSGTLTIGTSGSGTRISGLKMTNLVISGTAQAYISNCTIDDQVTKSSSGYVEIINSEMQCTSGIQISGAGTTIINGNKNVGIAVSNASAQVIIKGCNSVVTPSASAGNLAIVDCIVTALGGNGITITGASTTLTLLNSQVLVQAGNNVAPISVAGIYSIINTIYDKPGSTLTGTSTNSVDYFQYINADNITSTNGLTVTGSLTVTGGITGSAASASYVEYTNVANKPTLVSSSAQIVGYNVFATTGSNQFNGSQAVTGSLTVTGQVVAQTLNVQQVTSSIVYSSGSNIFGNSLSNTQQFTGSVSVTGSIAVAGALSGTSAIFSGSSTLLTLSSGAGTKAVFATTRNFGVNRNFQIAVDEFAESAFTITPSTTLGGSGYTTPIFTLAAAGAATFTSSVTAGDNYLINNTTASKKGYTYQSPASDWGPQVSGLYFNPNNAISATPTFTVNLWNGTFGTAGYGGFTDVLTINGAGGAATFSSSVTATNGIFLRNFTGANELEITNTSTTNGDSSLLRIKSGNTNFIIQAFNQNQATSGTAVANSVRFYNDGAGGLSLVGDNASAPIVFYSGGAANERMRITSGGNVGIGTDNPGQKLEVVGGEIKAGRVDTSSEGGQLSFGRASDNATAWYIDAFGSTSSPQLRFVNVSDSAVAMTLNSTGNLAVGTEQLPTLSTPSGGQLITLPHVVIVSGLIALGSPYTQNIQIDIVYNNWGGNNVLGLVDMIVTLREFANTSGTAFGKVFAVNSSGGTTFASFNTTNLTTSQCAVTVSSGGNYTLRITIDPSNVTDRGSFYLVIPNAGGTGSTISSITVSYV